MMKVLSKSTFFQKNKENLGMKYIHRNITTNKETKITLTLPNIPEAGTPNRRVRVLRLLVPLEEIGI